MLRYVSICRYTGYTNDSFRIGFFRTYEVTASFYVEKTVIFHFLKFAHFTTITDDLLLIKVTKILHAIEIQFIFTIFWNFYFDNLGVFDRKKTQLYGVIFNKKKRDSQKNLKNPFPRLKSPKKKLGYHKIKFGYQFLLAQITPIWHKMALLI